MKNDSSLTRIASWVIKRKSDGTIICETFGDTWLYHLNWNNYEAIPILQYLQSLNRSVDK